MTNEILEAIHSKDDYQSENVEIESYYIKKKWYKRHELTTVVFLHEKPIARISGNFIELCTWRKETKEKEEMTNFLVKEIGLKLRKANWNLD